MDEMTEQEFEVYERAADILAIRQHSCMTDGWLRDAHGYLAALRKRGIFLTETPPDQPEPAVIAERGA